MIRRATVSDAAAIARIHVHTWRVAYAGIVPADYLASLSEEKRTALWRQWLEDERIFLFVAVEEDEIIGWVAGGASRDADMEGESEIYSIYISPQHWKRNIGRALIEKMEEQFPTSANVTLWVLQDNHPAIKFYKKMGYETDGTKKEIQLGSAALSEIRMRKKRPAGV